MARRAAARNRAGLCAAGHRLLPGDRRTAGGSRGHAGQFLHRLANRAGRPGTGQDRRRPAAHRGRGGSARPRCLSRFRRGQHLPDPHRRGPSAVRYRACHPSGQAQAPAARCGARRSHLHRALPFPRRSHRRHQVLASRVSRRPSGHPRQVLGGPALSQGP